MSNPTEEFQQFNYDLTDFSWKKNLPSVTIECSEKSIQSQKFRLLSQTSIIQIIWKG